MALIVGGGRSGTGHCTGWGGGTGAFGGGVGGLFLKEIEFCPDGICGLLDDPKAVFLPESVKLCSPRPPRGGWALSCPDPSPLETSGDHLILATAMWCDHFFNPNI